MATGVFGGQCVEGHTAYIYDRGASTRVAQLLDISDIQWERDRDSISEANIVISGSACSAQAKMLSNIEPKRNEVVIFRGNTRVWEGPVWRVGWFSDHVEIHARDVMAYVEGTPLSIAYSSAYPNTETAVGRIVRILEHELPVWEALNPPANILPYVTPHHFPNEAKTSAVTKPFEMTVGEHIAHLAHYGGIDFAVIGRAIHLWDVSRPLGVTRTITEADIFGEIVVTSYGADMTASVYVVAQDGRYGHAAETSSYYGPWTTILSAYGEQGTDAPTQDELNSQAKRNLSGRLPVPVEVRVPDSSGIRLDDTLTIDMLVPGVQIPLLATLNARQMSQMQKLDKVVVKESPDGETVQVTLTPATKPDSDDPEEP